ncbi:MAG: MFS transporter [Clostridiales Family XIII bacterium]|nr:MFS transporter [Clostridiales Family XIII bacterium]
MLLGHATTDITQGSLPAILPFLIAEHHYTYAAAAGLVFAGNLLSAVSQPIFGWLGDKAARPWFMLVGILLAAVGITLVGFLDNYAASCAAVVVMGIGVSLFHPEGSKLANIAAGRVNKGIGMSIFSVGGNIGFTGGPIIATAAILAFGLRGTAVFLIPAVVVSFLLAPHMKDFERLGRDFKEQVKEDTKAGELPPDNVKGFTAVAVVTFFRAVMASSLNTFIPLFWIGVFLKSTAEGNLNLSIYAAAGIVATLAGGRLADRFGFRAIIRACCIAVPPLFFLFVYNRSPIAGTFLIVFVSIFLAMSNSALMVTGQSFMPNRIGMASGVLFGLTISMGGLVAPIIGRIGDVYGLERAMFTIACFSIGALVAVFFIPKITGAAAPKSLPPPLAEEGGNL